MIKPVNSHLIIEPIKHETFIAQDNATYEEIGVVISIAEGIHNIATGTLEVQVGDKVYFDSWLAAKFPTGKDDEFFWLVKWEDVRAIEHVEIPE